MKVRIYGVVFELTGWTKRLMIKRAPANEDNFVLDSFEMYFIFKCFFL